MNKILKAMSYVLVAALASAATFAVMAFEPADRYDKLDELKALVDQKVIGEIDWKIVEDNAASGMIAGLGDRWSYYISADEYAEYLENGNNEYVGIGVTVQLSKERFLHFLFQFSQFFFLKVFPSRVLL